MRLLTDYELDLVAGGTSSSDGTYYDIIVIGHRYSGGTPGWYFTETMYPTNPGGGGGSPLQNSQYQQTLDANDTPCVNELPSGMDANDLNRLNDLAKFSAGQIAALQDATGHEYGAMIYRGTDGQLYQTDPFTAGHPNDMDGAHAQLPAGAVVVGYLHTHPVNIDMDERTLSGDDRDFIRDLIEHGGTNVTADPNMLAYVVTKDEETSYKTYVYDRSKRTSNMQGCTL